MDLTYPCIGGEIKFNKYCMALSTETASENKKKYFPHYLKESLNIYLNSIFRFHQGNVLVVSSRNIMKFLTEKTQYNAKLNCAYFLSIENTIESRLSFTCDSVFFLCNNSSQKCIVPQFVCDGEPDCPHYED